MFREKLEIRWQRRGEDLGVRWEDVRKNIKGIFGEGQGRKKAGERRGW